MEMPEPQFPPCLVTDSRLDGITLLSKVRERDLVGNKVADSMVAVEERLDLLSEATIRDTESWG